MVVAVAVVHVVEVALDQVVGVVAVRDGLMTTAGAVPMGLVVLAAVVRGSAGRRVQHDPAIGWDEQRFLFCD